MAGIVVLDMCLPPLMICIHFDSSAMPITSGMT